MLLVILQTAFCDIARPRLNNASKRFYMAMLDFLIGGAIVLVIVATLDRRRYRQMAERTAMYRQRYNMMVRHVRQIRSAKNFNDAKVLADAALELKEGNMTTEFAEM